MPLVSPSRKSNGGRKTPIERRADRVVAAGQSLAATGRRLNQDPTLLGIVRSVRAVLPGRLARRRPDGARRGAAAQGRRAGCSPRSRPTAPACSARPASAPCRRGRRSRRPRAAARGKTELAIAFTDLVDFSDWALDAGDDRRDRAAARRQRRDRAPGQVQRRRGGEAARRRDDGRLQERRRRPRRARGRPRAPGGGRRRRLRAAGSARASTSASRARSARTTSGSTSTSPPASPTAAEPGELLLSDAALEAVGSDKVKVKERPLLRRQGGPRGPPGLRGQRDPGRRLPPDQRRALDPAGRDRAPRQPLLGPGRPARQCDRLADRGGVRRRRLRDSQRGRAPAPAGEAGRASHRRSPGRPQPGPQPRAGPGAPCAPSSPTACAARNAAARPAPAAPRANAAWSRSAAPRSASSSAANRWTPRPWRDTLRAMSEEHESHVVARSLEPEAAWNAVQLGFAEILDLRTETERRRYGAPPRARPVSLVKHIASPEGPGAIYLCQRAIRSKATLRRGAAEVAGGFAAWIEADLPVEEVD